MLVNIVGFPFLLELSQSKKSFVGSIAQKRPSDLKEKGERRR